MTWRHIRVFIMPVCDMRFVAKARANENAPPHPYNTMRPRDFLEMLDQGRTYPDIDMPTDPHGPRQDAPGRI